MSLNIRGVLFGEMEFVESFNRRIHRAKST